jgi:hypothetical protein
MHDHHYFGVTGVTTVHAEANILIDGGSVFRETDGLSPNSGDADKTWVDAKIAIAPDDTNGIGEEHTFTVTVMEDDGSGGGFAAAAGEHVDFTLTDAGGLYPSSTQRPAPVIMPDPTPTPAVSACRLHRSAGTVTGHASSGVGSVGYPCSARRMAWHRTPDDAVKTYVDGSLSWLKRQHGALLQRDRGLPHHDRRYGHYRRVRDGAR